MKKDILLYIFFFCLCNIIHGQTRELPDDSMIFTKHIKTITEWLSRDSIINEADVCYKYNSLGKLTITEYFPDRDSIIEDTSFDYNFYFYENNKLIKELRTGIWDTETMRVDTVETKYTYDSSNNLIEERIVCVNRKWNYKIKKTYDSHKRVLQIIYENAPNCTSQGVDSLFYQNDKIILNINHKINRRISYNYNIDGTLSLKSDGQLNDTTYIHHKNYFYYVNGLLTSEREYHSVDGKNNYSERTFKYYYNDRGLVQKIERYRDDKLYNYTTLTYEYY